MLTYEAARRRLKRARAEERHLQIVHAVAQTVSRSLDVDEVLRTALDALTHVTGHETRAFT